MFDDNLVFSWNAILNGRMTVKFIHLMCLLSVNNIITANQYAITDLKHNSLSMSTHHKTVLSSNYTRLLFDQRDQMFFIAKVWYQENITVDYKRNGTSKWWAGDSVSYTHLRAHET